MDLSRRDFLKLGAATLLAAALQPPGKGGGFAASAASIVYRGSRRHAKIAMTYDDCYWVEVLERLIELARPYPNVHFTFFAVGDAFEKDEAIRPGIWKRIHEHGHEIGYHTYTHVTFPALADMLIDFDRWMNKLQQVLGFAPEVHFARPPGNDLTHSFEQLCQERGMVVTQFSTGFEAGTMEESMRLAARASSGDIVQMHTYQDPPNNRFDLAISEKAVPYLVDKGYSLVTMSELYDDLLREQYSSDGCDIGAGSSPTRTCIE